jgi:hypothetical protein
MTVPGPLPWLRFGGVEIANGARSMEYWRSLSPIGGKFELADSYPCAALYAEAGATSPASFVAPEVDPAPWYDSDEILSTYFYGFVPRRIEGTMASMVTRAVAPRFGGIEGGKLGPEHRGPRTIVVRGLLVGRGGVGLDFGLNWLSSVLAASACDQCARAELEVYNACPDGLGSPAGKYLLYDVGLAAGPAPTGEAVPGDGCDFQEITFTLVAENPWLYEPVSLCLAETIVGADEPCDDPLVFFQTGEPGTPHCCEVTPPSSGVLGSIITIDAPSGVGGLECGIFTTGCPPAADDQPVKAIYVERLEPGESLVIDSSRRTVRVFQTIAAVPGTLCGGGPCGDTIEESDGFPLLHFPTDRTLEWLDLAPCDLPDACFCVRTTHPCSGGGDATVKIETQLRVR